MTKFETQDAGFVDDVTQNKINDCEKAMRSMLDAQSNKNGPIAVGSTLLILAAEFCEQTAAFQKEQEIREKFVKVAEAIYKIMQRRSLNAN